MKKFAENKVQAPALSVAETVKARVDAAIREKIDALLQDFRKQQDQDFAELERLQGEIEELEKKRATVAAERDGLLKGFFGAGSKGFNDVDLKLRGLEEGNKSLEEQIEKLFLKLTEIPKFDFPFLNFLNRWKP